MNEEKTEGIVLKSVPYKDKERILTLFTPSSGLISLIIKNVNKTPASLLAPFSKGEFIYKKGRSDLCRLLDGDILNDNLSLRNSLASLQTAGVLGQAILSTQLPGKPAAGLYFLFDSYLRQIPLFPSPSTLLASFYLKMLKHEGLLHLQEKCSRCLHTNATSLDKGESLCKGHGPKGLLFSSIEWELLLLLQNSRSFEGLKKIEPTSGLAQTIQNYFRECVK